MSGCSLPSVSLTGHVIDCPPSLSTGCTILLNVKVYLTRKAFEKADKANREENGTFWQEQKETMEEEVMRHRKEALGLLFGVYTNRERMLMTQAVSASRPSSRMRYSPHKNRMDLQSLTKSHSNTLINHRNPSAGVRVRQRAVHHQPTRVKARLPPRIAMLKMKRIVGTRPRN